MQVNIEQLRKEAEYWKNLYNLQVNKNKQLEQQLGIMPEPAGPPQSKDPPPAEPVSSGEPNREEIKNKLRLACSRNDITLLQEAIKEAEALGMEEAQYARRKLNSLS